MTSEYLEITVTGKRGSVKLVVYPQSSKAMVFEEQEPYAGESRYQLVEGGTYTYEFIGGRYQFEKENEIVRFHPNKLHHASEGTLTTGIYVGHLTLDVVEIDTHEQMGRVSLEIRSTKAEYRSDYRLMLDEIAEYYTDLVLQQGAPVTQRLEIDQNCSAKTLYQRFSFVRSLIDSESFSEAIHKIISNPVRKWTDANIERNIVGVRRLSRKNIRQITSSIDREQLSPEMRVGMPEYLTSVPRRIEVDYKRDTTDCQENQFVKFVLRTFVNFCSEIKSYTNASEQLKAETEQEAERQERIIHIHFDAKYRLDKVLLEDKDTGRDISEELAGEKQELKIYKRGDLLKMHAYKDAIRRTSGAYVLYPGEENRELRGFHEIVPGLGAFSIRPGHWLQDSTYLKQFLAEVKAHLLDRTSDREKLSYYEYDVHLAANESMTMESLPEAEGENRSFLPDETTVLIGYYKSQEHLEWILRHWMYNGRAGDRKGTLSISKEIVTARYLLLLNGKETVLHKINLGGPKVYGYKEMKALDYPFNPDDNNEDKIYLMFRLNKKGVEKELQKYTWDPRDIEKLKPSRFGKLGVVRLTELIKVAKTI